jgi:hypothetical protein
MTSKIQGASGRLAMRLHRSAVVLAGVLAFAGLVAPVAAQEAPAFSFVINTNLQNLHPDVDRMRFTCSVCPEDCVAFAGSNSVEFSRDGAASFTETVTVPVSVADPSVAVEWFCDLRLVDSTGQAVRPANGAPAFAAPGGQPLNVLLRGEFPQ